MNLIEAIKSGRTFGVKGCPQRIVEVDHQGNGLVFVYDDNRVEEIGVEDLLYEGYEVRDPAVTITRSQFWQAFDCAKTTPAYDGYDPTISGFVGRMAQKLGLGEP